MNRYALIVLIFIGICYQAHAQTISICSWNLKDFGKAKSDEEIEFIAETIRNFDLVAVQEVVAGYGGPQAVARLNAALNRKGYKWDYLVSNPTSSSAYKTERYAFLWKTAKLKKVGKEGLEKSYNLKIDREPYVVYFMSGTKVFTVMNFHAITKAKQPETEVKYLRFLPALYSKYPLMFAGDFNLPQSHSVFGPLKKMGYKTVLIKQKTSLRQKCLSDGCLASELDNIFYKPSQFKFLQAGIIHFYKNFNSLKQARLVSDHVPVYFKFTLN